MAGKEAGQAAGEGKALVCASCGAALIVRAVGRSLAVTCRACGATNDVTNPDVVKVLEYNDKLKHEPAIPLGARGKFHGVTWEVIGYMVRADVQYTHVEWREYLLFNPQRGFRFLAELDGHWNYVVMTKEKPSTTDTGAFYLGNTYRVFTKGRARVVAVYGEFYWRVKRGDIVVTEDFVRPPEMLSMESEDKEVTWSVAEYMSREQVLAAFAPAVFVLPETTGFAPNQPLASTGAWKAVGKTALMGLVGLVMLQIFTSASMPSHDVVEYAHEWNSLDAADKTQVTPEFEIKGRVTNLEVALYAPVDNSWFEVGVQLVGQANEEPVEFETGVEFYHGYDGGESWVEGSKWGSVVLSSVPPGKYHLNLTPVSPGGTLAYRIIGRSSVTTWTNFWFALLFIGVPALVLGLRAYGQEKERWSTSDFSPYDSSGDD